jgi:YidC/Oxa1 family membrane protein insertase
VRSKKSKYLLLLVLLVAMLALSGCGVSNDGVDVTTTPPEGLWQTLVVWPLAKALIWIDEALQNIGVRYHWGWAIILFTVIVKIITFPLTLSQIRGMQAQKELQPKIQELQKKYGKDREKLSQEQMKLYKEAGVNPLSGCLPLLIQMPILFGLYAALVALGPSLTNAAFFWIPDLGFPEYSQGLSWISEAWAARDFYTLIAYLILPLLLMVSQFVMQKWMTPTPTATDGDSSNPMGGMTKQLTLMMTFMFGFFTLQVPAGLTLYWVTSNFLQMLQQWLVTDQRFGLAKKITPALATAGAAPALPDSQKPSSNGTAAITTTANGATPDKTDEKPKDTRRRRTKRR